MANTSILAAFERMWQHVVAKLGDKANLDHTHDDRYYTEAEVDLKVSEVNTAVTNIVNGTTTVPKAVRATSADSATSATKATQDASGNVITSTYETKEDATTKLNEAKSYTDIEIDKLSDTVAFIDSTDNESVSDANNTLTTAHIVDGLNSSSSSMVLSAKQGKVLNERINTLEDGSTTGDAELEDARIDKDGNTHDNVGEHIRNVTSQLSSEIADLTIVNQNGGGALKIWAGSQAEYDALLVKEEDTVYLIDGTTSSGGDTGGSEEGGDDSGNDNTGEVLTEPVYTLANELTLDGSGIGTVDTNISLFDADRDFTIFADFTPQKTPKDGEYQMVIFRVKQTDSPWIGIDVALHNAESASANPNQNRGELSIIGSKAGIYLGKMATGVSSVDYSRHKFAIKRVASEKKMYFYDSDGMIGSYNDSGDVASSLFNETIILGYGSGKSLYFNGTIHAFKVWHSALEEADVISLFS